MHLKKIPNECKLPLKMHFTFSLKIHFSIHFKLHVTFLLGMGLYFYFWKIKQKIKFLLYFLYFLGKHFSWAEKRFGKKKISEPFLEK
jgi:hypothetical protein